MARRPRKPRSVGQAGLLLLAGAASVEALALSSLEKADTSPLSCTLAYNAPILGCLTSDFSTKRCSRLCVQSIGNVQDRIQRSCGKTQASQGSLLSRAQTGDLANALCGTGSPAAQPTITATATVIESTSSTPPLTTSTSVETFTTLPTSTALTTIITQSTTSTTLMTSITESTTSTTSTSLRVTTSSPTLLEPTTNSSPPQSTTNQPSPTSSEAAKPTPSSDTGGGSPFDFTASAPSPPGKHTWTMGLVASCVVAALLMQ